MFIPDKNKFHKAEEIFRAGVAAADPCKLVRRSISLSGSILSIDEESCDLDCFERIFLLGAGKACDLMGRGVEEAIGDRLTGGVVIVPDGSGSADAPIPRIAAAHPIPDKKGIRAAEELISIARSAGSNDLVIVLLSGGGSALLSALEVGISLEDLRGVTETLLKCGASIGELNAIRKHLSRVKGGGLARLLYPARVITLILSDVVGDDPAVIASGPTAPDSSTFRDCLNILDRYEIRELVPDRIVKRLEEGRADMISETPDGSDPVFRKVRNVVIGNNRIALIGAAEKARKLGRKTVILSDRIIGDTRRAAKIHCALAAAVLRPRAKQPVCLLSGGETTVSVKGRGQGGRNTEFVLACAREISGRHGITILSGGTDGIDAHTSAAGAICDGTTIARGELLGLEAGEFLDRNDSYTYFNSLGDLLITGATGTNVMDLRVILID